MGGAASGKKQREVYVGNLTIGAVTDVMLRELFNGALAHLMPDPQLNPPVINVGMDPSGTAHPCLISIALVPCKVGPCRRSVLLEGDQSTLCACRPLWLC